MRCELCPLHESSLISNCMPGRGPSNPEIFLVGQGPGGFEDGQGIPFVGVSGQYLMEMLKDAGIDPDACFFTNATRCRPPLINRKERPPTPEEIAVCRRYLIQEVQRVRPKVIVALGDSALRSLCKTSGVKGKRGQEFPLHPDFGYECSVFVTYHPSAVRRTQPLRPTVVSDLRRVRDRGRESEPIDWIWAEQPSFYGGTVAYDIETIDENGQIGEQATQIAFATPGPGDVIVCRWPVDVMFPKPTQLISHFGWDFDDKRTGFRSTRDTAALAHLDDENQPLGLESLCVKYLGVKGWKEDRNGACLGSDELAEYNARDALNTLRLHDHLVDRLGNRVRIADLILLPARLALDECSARGVRIDLNEVLAARNHFADSIMEARVACRALAGDSQLNPGSTAQVALRLRGRGHHLPKTEGNHDATGKAILSGLGDEFGDAVIRYREAVKSDSTYGRPYEEAARAPDQRMRCFYTIVRTRTGRTSSQRHPDYDPSTNLQNLPRALRSFLTGICIADYAGIEFRLAAWLANESTIVDNYAQDPHWDCHAYMAERTGLSRQAAKTVNFASLYDVSSKVFREVYPGFVPWWDAIKDEIKLNGFVESPTRRRRHFGTWDLMPYSERQSAWREAVNFPVQSLAADLALLALSCCHRAGLPINGFFHDAIGFDTRDWEPDVEAIRRCMLDEPLEILRSRFGVNIDIPLEVEIKVQ